MQHFLLLFLFFIYIISEKKNGTAAMGGSSLLFKDSNLYTADIIAHDGYPVETHDVITNDGYIINVQRIPGKPHSTPVIIIHGLWAESHNWVLNGRNLSLAYVLANHGFDVWLGNVRGNLYGKMHVRLSPRDSRFWAFSMDEIGMCDLPGIISYIHQLTNERIIFIGYSMGAVTGLMMNAKRHDMNSKLRLMIHFGPPIFMNTAEISSNRWIYFFSHIKPVLEFLKLHEGPPGVHLIKWLTKNGCHLSDAIMEICEEILLSTFHYDRAHFTHSALRTMTEHILDTTSITVINHFVQWIKTGRFSHYDYGLLKNVKRYHRISPPDYDLNAVNVPTAIFYTESDDYVSVQAIEELYNLIPAKAGLIKVDDDHFSHLHFPYATNAPDLIYHKMIKLMNLY